MPVARVNGVNLYYEVTGKAFPLSDVPTEPAAYSHEMAIKDLYQLLRDLGVKQAYVGGLSLGGNVALNSGISHPDMVKALIGQRRGQAQLIGKRSRSGLKL